LRVKSVENRPVPHLCKTDPSPYCIVSGRAGSVAAPILAA
jgi:hypothetical protein